MREYVSDTTEDCAIEYLRGTDLDPAENMLINISHICGVSVEMVKSKSRLPKFVMPRQLFCFFTHKLFNQYSLNQIANRVNINHASVLYHCNQVKKAMVAKDANSLEVQRLYKLIEKKLLS